MTAIKTKQNKDVIEEYNYLRSVYSLETQALASMMRKFENMAYGLSVLHETNFINEYHRAMFNGMKSILEKGNKEVIIREALEKALESDSSIDNTLYFNYPSFIAGIKPDKSFYRDQLYDLLSKMNH